MLSISEISLPSAITLFATSICCLCPKTVSFLQNEKIYTLLSFAGRSPSLLHLLCCLYHRVHSCKLPINRLKIQIYSCLHKTRRNENTLFIFSKSLFYLSQYTSSMFLIHARRQMIDAIPF